MGETFVVNRLELKKMLTSLNVSDKNADSLLLQLDKAHRHVNGVAFAGMLQKLGLKQADVANTLRRIGVNDVTITSILNALDEEKISSSFGRVVDLTIE